MSYLIASHRPTKDGSMPIPTMEDGEPYEWGMVYSQQTRIVWCEDVEEMIAALVGDDAYLHMSEQDRLVERIKVAIRIQVAFQARLNLIGQQNGDWDRCTLHEQTILNGPRFEQPKDITFSLFGRNWWGAPIPLVLVSTGYFDGPVEQVPVGEPGAILWLCPETSEDLLDTLGDWGLVNVFRRSE